MSDYKGKGGMNHGICSPMAETMGHKVVMPKIAENTMLKGSAPKAAPMQSPTKPKNPAR